MTLGRLRRGRTEGPCIHLDSVQHIALDKPLSCVHCIKQCNAVFKAELDSDRQTDLVLKFSPTPSSCLTLGRYLINLSTSLSLLLFFF